MKATTGVIHGNTIELSESPGFSDGENVVVFIHPTRCRPKDGPPTATSRALPGPPAGWYPGCTETAAGLLADLWNDEDDKILAQIEEDRRSAAWREIDE